MNYKVEVDWTGAGDYSGANDDITAYVRSIRCKRGRNYASTLTGRSAAGTCDIDLVNTDGRFNSFNTSSPLTGNLVPGRRLRILASDNAAQFTRTNSEYLSADGTQSVFNPGDANYTICGWVKPDELANNRGLIGKWGTTALTRDFLLYYVKASNRFSFILSDGSSTGGKAYTAVTPEVGKWFFIVCWHDPSENKAYIQVNDNNVESGAWTGGINSSATDFILGAYGSPANFFGGQMARVGIWWRLLTAAERTWLYNSGWGRSFTEFGNGDGGDLARWCEAYWELNEKSGSRADSSKNSPLSDNATVTYNDGVDIPLWEGWVDSIVPRPELGQAHTATLRGIGSLGYINDREVNVDMKTSIATGAAVTEVLDKISWAAADRAIDTGQITMTRWWTGGNKVKALTALRDIEETEAGFVREGRDGKIIFEDRWHRQQNDEGINSQWSFTDRSPLNAAAIDRSGGKHLQQASDSALQIGDNDFTLAAWVRVDSDPGANGGIVGKWTTNAEFLLYYVTANGRFGSGISDGAGDTTYTNSLTIIGEGSKSGQWYFLTLHHDATSNVTGMTVNDYSTVPEAAHTTGIDTDGTDPLEVGRYNSTDTLLLDGAIGPVGMWSRRISNEERKQLYNKGQGLYYNDLPANLLVNLTAYWDMTEGDGAIRASSVGTGLDFDGTYDAGVTDATFARQTGYSQIAQQDPFQDIFNIVKAGVTTYTVGAEATLWTLNDTPEIQAGESKTFWAEYPSPYSATDAVAVNAWSDLVATTDYTANSQSDGGGIDRTGNITVVQTKFDTTQKLVVTNNSTANTAYLTLLQAPGTPVTADDPVIVKAEDTTSQATYGERDHPLPAKFLPTTAAAESWANYLIAVYKDPRPVLVIEFPAFSSSRYEHAARILDVSDRIYIVANNNSDLGISEAFFIEAINHSITDGGKVHRVTLECSPASASGGFWKLGVGELGITTRLSS